MHSYPCVSRECEIKSSRTLSSRELLISLADREAVSMRQAGRDDDVLAKKNLSAPCALSILAEISAETRFSKTRDLCSVRTIIQLKITLRARLVLGAPKLPLTAFRVVATPELVMYNITGKYRKYICI